MPILLPDGTQVKQRQVDKSASVTDNLSVPTLSYTSQKSLEDDLNYLRSILKQIKGTVKYDSPLSSTLEALYQELQEAVFYDAELQGVPTAPEPIPSGDYSDRVSTTQFVTDVVNTYLSGQPGDSRKVMSAPSPNEVIPTGDLRKPNRYVWYFEHGLNKFPSVTLVNTDKKVIEGIYEYVSQDNQSVLSQNHVKITLTSEELSKVIFN